MFANSDIPESLFCCRGLVLSDSRNNIVGRVFFFHIAKAGVQLQLWRSNPRTRCCLLVLRLLFPWTKSKPGTYKWMTISKPEHSICCVYSFWHPSVVFLDLLEQQACGPEAGVWLSLGSFISGSTCWKEQLHVVSCLTVVLNTVWKCTLLF